MSFFRPRWLHRMIRRRTTPIHPDKAMNMKEKLSVAYMLIGWNILGIIMYMSFTGRKDWPEYYGLKSPEEAAKKPSVYYAELLNIKRADIIRYKGFTKVEEEEYVAPDEVHVPAQQPKENTV